MAEYLVLTLDCVDLDVQTPFWCGALGYRLEGSAEQYRSLAPPSPTQPKVLLQRVPEAKTAKNRLHLDLHVPDVDAEARRLEGLGATRIGRVDQFGIHWIVMHDPEGNEFCVVPSESAFSTPGG
jgi:predicted enzyme related to lactoylglutathione lyase